MLVLRGSYGCLRIFAGSYVRIDNISVCTVVFDYLQHKIYCFMVCEFSEFSSVGILFICSNYALLVVHNFDDNAKFDRSDMLLSSLLHTLIY